MSNELQKATEPLNPTDPPPSQEAGDRARALAVSAMPVPPSVPSPLPAPITMDRLPAVATPTFNAGVFVHRALRGRYVLVVLLGLITGAACAYLAWKVGRPIYLSEGLVRIRYNASSEGSGDRTAPHAIVVNSHKTLILSSRTVEMARQDRVWARSGAAVPDAQYFARNLSVDAKSGSEFLRIIVRDYDRNKAALAVNAIVNAYQYLAKDQERFVDSTEVGILEARRTALMGKIDTLQGELAEAMAAQKAADESAGAATLPAAAQAARGNTISAPVGSAIQDLYRSAAFEFAALHQTLVGLRIDIVTMSGGAAGAAPGNDAAVQANAHTPASQPVAAERSPLTPEEIADQGDRKMAELLGQKAISESRLRDMQVRKQWGASHPSVQEEQRMLGVVEASIRKRAEEYRLAAANAPQNKSPTAPAIANNNLLATAGRSLAQLKSSKDRIERLLTPKMKEMTSLGQLQEVHVELNKLVAEIDRAKERDIQPGRMSVISTGEVPLTPVKDPRLYYAAGGGIVGLCLPAGAVVLFSMTRRRYRYSDETQQDAAARSNIPLLGILPELPSKSSDVEPMLAAAHSVHQIRVSLEAQESNNGSRAYLITSSTAGEGKTSLAMSLGLSFAAAGLRTLVMDCDLVGRHLTSSFRAKDMDGIQEALAAGSLRQFIRKTYGGLHLLTAGRASTANACALPAGTIRSLLREARRYFHVVLIDTGPILGSLEAAVLAQEADGVIFTISQGQHRRLVEHAMRRLESLRVRVAGLIFNRAKAQDFHHSPFGSSSRSSYAVADESRGTRAEIGQLNGFGPLVHAVAAGIPAAHN